MRYLIFIQTAPSQFQYGYAAWKFSSALLDKGYPIESIFFYGDGTLYAQRYTLASDNEFDLGAAWSLLTEAHQVPLYVCSTTALQRGIVDEASIHLFPSINSVSVRTTLRKGFQLTGLGTLALGLKAVDRIAHF